MGIRKDSADFVMRGILVSVKTVFVFALLVLIGYVGYKFISANYSTHPRYVIILLGFFIGDFFFVVIVERFIDQVLLKGRY